MPFEIKHDRAAGILHARYGGVVDMAQRIALARRVLAEAERTGSYRWLLDFRDAQSLVAEEADVARMADEFSPQLPAGTRMAYLLRYDHQLNAALEDSMRSRGVPVERFHDADAAIAWLQATGDGVEGDDGRDVEPGPGQAPAPAATDDPQVDLRHALRLVGEIVEANAPVSPDQFAALGELVQALLEAGLDDAAIRRVCGRMAHAMRGLPRS